MLTSMMRIIFAIFYFLLVKFLFHPVCIIFGGILLFIIFLKRLSPRTTRHLETDDFFWYKNIPASDTIRLVWCDSFVKEEVTGGP